MRRTWTPGAAGLLMLLAGLGGCGTPGGADLPTPPTDLTAPAGEVSLVVDLTMTVDAPDLSVPPAVLDLTVPVATIDTSLPPCGNSTRSCGSPGNCLDCSASTLGTACVGGACGCSTPSDCPAGQACDAGKHQCGATCDPTSAPCNGGCCDSGSCIAGTTNAKCGSDGKACNPCGGGTPTCTSGSCAAACVVQGMGQSGTCGTGFCCSAANSCLPIGDHACSLSGGACSDCVKSPDGAKCLATGLCGCSGASDCPRNQACKNGNCGTLCDASTPCNGGCCAGGQCVAGNGSSSCALGTVLCGSCAGNPAGVACISANNKIFCGCAGVGDCGFGEACDRTSHTCSAKCDANTPCNAGCCTAAQNGTCVAGGSTNACGSNGGLCTDCGANGNGRVCVPAAGGGVCGCNSIADCPASANACSAKRCDTACLAGQPCQFGCCLNGVCTDGTTPAACGRTGTVCTNCSKSGAGTSCRANQACGCERPEDCSPGQACNLVSHTCTPTCDSNNTTACNGGCCSATLNGICQPGTDGKACGNTVCTDCSQSALGHFCVAAVSCGCRTAADCAPNQACDGAQKQCTSACNANQQCNGGCCQNGTCVVGTANSACGGNGLACVACVDGKPTCDNSVCTNRCVGPGAGVCGNGNCCSAGVCAAGNQQSTCGFSGICRNCAGSSTGTRCTASNNPDDPICGCTARGDCLAADPLMSVPGQSCDTENKSCTSQCGVQGLSGCNGGCCSGANGQCRAGSTDNACGLSGGFCNSCTSTCNPGPHCDPTTGACGCTNLSHCYDNGYFGGSCNANMVGRLGCNLMGSGACCVRGGVATLVASLCCTGLAINGVCTCLPNGTATMNNNPSTCCSLNAAAGNCACRPSCGTNNVMCTSQHTCFQNSDCCSNHCAQFGAFSVCLCQNKGGSCQTDDGCCPGTKCTDPGTGVKTCT